MYLTNLSQGTNIETYNVIQNSKYFIMYLRIFIDVLDEVIIRGEASKNPHLFVSRINPHIRIKNYWWIRQFIEKTLAHRNLWVAPQAVSWGCVVWRVMEMKISERSLASSAPNSSHNLVNTRNPKTSFDGKFCNTLLHVYKNKI